MAEFTTHKTFAEAGFTIPANRSSGQIYLSCHRCSATRTKKNNKCLSLNLDLGVWTCHHCDWVGRLESTPRQTVTVEKKEYSIPPQNTGTLSPFWATEMKRRGITDAVLLRNKIFSAKVYFPQVEEERDAVIFPYLRGEQVVNHKYRSIEKMFRSFAGAEKPLYGLNDINNDSLIWVEGEMDKLTMEVAGFLSCVSIPMGAPKAGSINCDKRLECIGEASSVLEPVKSHIIAVDNDPNGNELQSELIRRLGVEKCILVQWPVGCKDANDVLRLHGVDAIKSCIEAAKPAPIAGVFTADDVAGKLDIAYEQGPKKGKNTGWASVDNLYTVREGEFTVLTGVPSSGKSEWLDALMVNLADSDQWRFGVCSPENQPIEYHVQKLMEKKARKPFDRGTTPRMDREEFEYYRDWVSYFFRFILPEEPTLEAIFERAKRLVRRDGIRGLVIDPWNEIEGSRPPGLSETEYISVALGKARRFARDQGVHLWIVAHPTKIRRDPKTNKIPTATLYDISGSAHWRNKADNGIVVEREISSDATAVSIHVQKIRFKGVGRIGSAVLQYDRVTGCYRE